MPTDFETAPMVIRADHVPGPRQGCWTYADCAAIPEDGARYEVIGGVLYMAAAPNRAHQAAVVRFTGFLFAHVEEAGLGRVFVSPFDVTLPSGDTVQSDVIVVLNAHLSIITEGRIVGVPDLVIEVLAPGTSGYDRRGKQDLYARAGVPEYWLAGPYARTIEPLWLRGGAYESLGVFTGTATLPSTIVQHLPVRIEQFFA